MAAEYGRSLVGGLPLLVRLLGSEDPDAQAYAAAAIAMLGQDDSNVMVLTEERVLPALAKLVTTPVDLVRKHLALAVANICRLGLPFFVMCLCVCFGCVLLRMRTSGHSKRR